MGAQPVDKLQIMDWQNGVNCPPLDSTVWQITVMTVERLCVL